MHKYFFGTYFQKTGTSDPYVVLTQNNMAVKTKPVPKTLNPAWNEYLEMGIYEKDLITGELQIQVFDKDLLTDDSIGSAKLLLSQIPHNNAQEFNINVRFSNTLLCELFH